MTFIMKTLKSLKSFCMFFSNYCFTSSLPNSLVIQSGDFHSIGVLVGPLLEEALDILFSHHRCINIISVVEISAVSHHHYRKCQTMNYMPEREVV